MAAVLGQQESRSTGIANHGSKAPIPSPTGSRRRPLGAQAGSSREDFHPKRVSARVYPGGVAGGDHDHRHLDRPALTGGPGGPARRRGGCSAATTSSRWAWPSITTNRPTAPFPQPNRSVFPTTALPPAAPGGADCRGEPIWVVMLPYLEQSELERLYTTFNNTTANSWGWANWKGKTYGVGCRDLPTSVDRSTSAPPTIACASSSVCGTITASAAARPWEPLLGWEVSTTTGCSRPTSGAASPRSRTAPRIRWPSAKASIRRSGATGRATTPVSAGPDLWPDGMTCTSVSSQSLTYFQWCMARTLRSAKRAINSSIMPLQNSEANEVSFGSGHPGGCQFVFGDGHVGFLNNTIDMNVYRALATRAGGETITGNAY